MATSSDYENCLLYDFIIEGILMGTICLFGFTGNTISMICLSRNKSTTATPFLLISLGLADTLFLITVLLLRVLTSIHTFTGCFEGLMDIFPYIGVYVWPCALITTTTTIYVTFLVTVNRYIAVSRPMHAPSMYSVNHAQLHVVLVAIFCILYNLPRFFEYKVNWYVNSLTNKTEIRTTLTRLGEDALYRIIYSNILYVLVMFLIPLITLIILNFKLIKALRRAKQMRSQFLRSNSENTVSKSEEDITFMLIIVVLVFVICQTPALITQRASAKKMAPERDN